MAPTTLYIVRHGQTTWNLEGRLQGDLDSPLTERGRKQASAAGNALKGIPLTAAFASPAGRAMETAELLLGERDLPITTMEGLKEIGLGLLEGMSKTEAEKAHTTQYHNFWERPHLFCLEKAETLTQVQTRVLAAIHEIAKTHPGQSVVLISHAIAIKTALAFFLKKELTEFNDIALPKNGSILALHGENDSLSLLEPEAFTRLESQATALTC